MPTRDPSAPPSARPAPAKPTTPTAAPRANETRLPQAPGSPRVPDLDLPPAATGGEDQDDRIQRYEKALTDPTIRDLIKRFEADIIARELGDAQAWLDRLKGKDDRHG